MTALDRLRALCNFHIPENANRGIITAADDRYFPGVQMLTAACAGRVPLCIYDAGLSLAQRGWCVGRARVLEFPSPIMPRTVPLWQSWNKPAMFSHSPFQTTLWLDADCLLVGDPTSLFERAEAGPFGCGVTLPYLRPNKEYLYERFPVPMRLPQECVVNSGVLGFGRDAQSQALLKAWSDMVQIAAHDEAIRNAFGYVEEGALHWAAETLSISDLCVRIAGWNRFVWTTGKDGPDAFVDRLKFKPGDVVQHLMIKPKPWKEWSDLETPHTF